LLAALGLEDDDARVRRTHQWIQDGDARREPLSSALVADPARAAARDSRREPTDVRPPGERPPDRSVGGATDPASHGAASDRDSADHRPDAALIGR
jgi:hypothetical protein